MAWNQGVQVELAALDSVEHAQQPATSSWRRHRTAGRQSGFARLDQPHPGRRRAGAGTVQGKNLGGVHVAVVANRWGKLGSFQEIAREIAEQL